MKKGFLSSTRARLGAIITTGAVLTTQVSASIDLSNVSFNTDDAFSVAALVLGAVAVLWGIRKAISLGNRG